VQFEGSADSVEVVLVGQQADLDLMGDFQLAGQPLLFPRNPGEILEVLRQFAAHLVEGLGEPAHLVGPARRRQFEIELTAGDVLGAIGKYAQRRHRAADGQQRDQ